MGTGDIHIDDREILVGEKNQQLSISLTACYLKTAPK